MPSPQVRAHAALAINQVVKNNRTIDWLALNKPKWLESPISQELVYGVTRFYFSLSDLVNAHLAKPLRGQDQDVYSLLLVGAYQLQYGHWKAHAIINETVNACKVLRKPWAKGLVNGVLRNLQRNLKNGDDGKKNTDRMFDHPTWLVSQLNNQYQSAEDILSANNDHPPMWIRVNCCKLGPQGYLAKLNEADIGFTQPLPDELPEAILLNQPMPTKHLPGWSNGEVAVQDLGAQLCRLVTQQTIATSQFPNHNTLDACAAPGNKYFHQLESFPLPGKHTALEQNSQRLKSLHTLATQLGHTPDSLLGDAGLSDWWDQTPFTHILVDAPCSGTGTIRRHPDIKLLLKEEHLPSFVHEQRRILDNLWQTLSPGGTLIYCTCSILAPENDLLIADFLNSATDANVLPIQLPLGQPTKYGWQLLPPDNTDGFFYAALNKTS